MNRATLIGADELHARIGSPQLLVVDCRFDLADAAKGRSAHRAGHVPGAVYADLNDDLSDLRKRGLGRHPLPDAAAFCAFLGRCGWHAGLQVVAYDDAAGALAAARLWWMLRLVGHARVAVLDGGVGAWTRAGLALESEQAARPPTHVEARYDPEQLVDTQRLQAERNSILLLDARAGPRFRGETETIDAVAGHVPGARNRPFSDNLQGACFKSPAALQDEFRALLDPTPPDAVVHMCGSGVTACHNLLAMEHAGLAGSRVYAPSWSGWISDTARPIATGA